MQDLSYMLSCLPKIGTERICALFGNGLSRLPYSQYKEILAKCGSRTKAADIYWKFLEKKIRKPSSDLYDLGYPGYFYLATLAKENLVNPVITTNWDSIFEKVLKLPKFNVDYFLNPCARPENLTSYDGYKCLRFKNCTTDEYHDSIRLWKIHGDTNYAYLSCCRKLMKLNPIMPIRRRNLYHMSCEKEGKVSLQHHIIEPRSRPIGFEDEINNAIKDLIRKDGGREVSVLLVMGFSGWDYEEIVKNIIDISNEGEIKIFYVNPCRWKDANEPLLFKQLSKRGEQIIREEADDVLMEIVKYYGLFDKYFYTYNYYFRLR